MDGNNVQPVVEILSEVLVGHFLDEILFVAATTRTSTWMCRRAAQTPKSAILQDAQELFCLVVPAAITLISSRNRVPPLAISKCPWFAM